MAKKDEKKVEKKKLKAGKANFTLIGNVKLGKNAFPGESESKKGYVSRRINLGVEVGNGSVVYSEGFGGFPGRQAPPAIVAFGKQTPDGKEGKRYEIAWEDRLSQADEIMNDITNVITVALEKLENDKLYYKRFLSMYDAIQYIEEHLVEGSRVKVKGRLVPNPYNGKTTYRKEINYIALYDGDEPDSATGQLSILVNKDSILKGRLKDDGEFDISARLIAYAKEVNGVEVKTNVPYDIDLVLPAKKDGTDMEKKAVAFILNMFNAKKDTVNEVGVIVNFEEGNVIQEAKIEDLDTESRQLIELGLLTEEEVLGKLTVRGGRVNRMVITKPIVVKEQLENGTLQVRPFFTESFCTEEELALPEKKEEAQVETAPATEDDLEALMNQQTTKSSEDDEWLKNLMG